MEDLHITFPGLEDREGDYRREDGLLICGRCGEPREAFLEPDVIIPGIDRHPVMCACDRARREREEAERREREHRRKVEELRKDCFPAPVMRGWVFGPEAEDNRQIAACRRFVENWGEVQKEKTGLLLWGAVGTGKTYLAACIANALLEREVPVRMTSLAEVIDRGMEERSKYIHALCACPLLILDDFGMERDTKFGLETVYRVVNERYLRGKPLIVTTNLTLEELKETDDTNRFRIYDRLRAMMVPVRFEGESLRRRDREKKLRFMKKLLSGGASGGNDPS